MTRAEYHKKMVALLAPSKTGRSSGIYNPRTGKFYTKNYAMQPRARKSPRFVRALAEAHDRAKARGVRVPKERFTGGGYKLHKPAPGYAHIGKARVTCRVYGTDEKGKSIKGSRMVFVVSVPMTRASTDEEIREVILEEVYAFRFKQQGRKRYIEEIDEVEIEKIELALHDKPEGEGKNEKVPF